MRVSPRGVRASVGPRVARVHVGTGRTRVSSGMGPLFASTTLAGGRSRARAGGARRTGPTPTQLVAQQHRAERAVQEGDRARAIAELEQTLQALVTAHRDTWPAAVRPVVAAPPLPTLESVRQEVRALALRGVGTFARQQRHDLRARADADAEAYLRDERARLEQVRAQLQAEADRWWTGLNRNDEEVVCEALNCAFGDNPAGGAALGVADGICSVLIRQPDLDDLPTQRAGVTPTGRPTLRKLTQRDRHRLFLQCMVANVAATLLEGFACAPGLDAITVCVLTRVEKTQRLGVVLAGRWTRTAVAATPWGTDADATGLVLDRAAELHLDLATTGAVRALDPTDVPGLAEVLALAHDDGAPEPDAPAGSAPSPLLVRPFLQWVAEAAAVPASPADPRASTPVPGHRKLAAGQAVTLTESETVLPVVVTALAASGVELDLSVLLLGEDGRVRTDLDLIFYNAPVSRTGAVRVDLPEDDGRVQHARAVIDARELAGEGVDRVAVIVSAGSCPLSQVHGLDLTVWVAGAPPFSPPVPQEPDLTAAVVCEVYRRVSSSGDEWRLRGTGQGWRDGLAGLARSFGISVD
ncbi:MAG: TerD family protein [Mycobacteriaceae bacterium]